MSYDIELGVRVYGTDLIVKIADSDPSQPTYNVRDIIVACTDWDFKQGQWYLLTDVLPNIKKGITEMQFNSRKYKDLLPENGWGNCSTVLESLEGILRTAQEMYEYRDLPIEYLYVRW